MRFVFYSIDLSPHLAPLAEAISKIVGVDNFLYVEELKEPWRGEKVVANGYRVTNVENAKAELETADIVCIGGIRPIGLIERRAAKGLRTIYLSERWFKPIRRYFSAFGRCFSIGVPGWVRMFWPAYRRMAGRFVKAVNESGCVTFFAIGPHAVRDFVRMGVRPEKIVLFGYYVENGAGNRKHEAGRLRVLWVGRMLGWKRVDTLIDAVGQCASAGMDVTLDIYGKGPEESRLRKAAARCGGAVKVHGFVPLREVRGLMRSHDTYVLSSDAQEGWGAVVNEALEEGMNVIGTSEAGASAAMLPMERLFRSGDAKALAGLLAKELRGELPGCSIGEWTADVAAKKMLEVCK